MASDQVKVLEKEYSTSEQYAKEQSKWERMISVNLMLIQIEVFEKGFVKHIFVLRNEKVLE